MRVLILSVFLAYAAAAPLQFAIVPFYPSPKLIIPPVDAAVPVAIPTVSPGDVQAATIDAQVKAEDQARAFADQARELAEQAAENQNEGIIEANELAKEKSEQAFWDAEEQKQQALDAERVAAAQAEAAMARSLYVPFMDPAGISESPAVEQAVPNAAAKAADIPAASAPEMAAETPAEAPKLDEQAAAVKMAEPEKPTETEAGKSADSVQVEAADIKSAAPEPAKTENQNPFLIQSLQQAPVFAAPLSIAPLAYGQPFVAPVAYVQPGLKTVPSPAIHPVQGHFVAPQVLQAQW